MTKRIEGTAADVKGREKVDGTKGIDDRRLQRQREKRSKEKKRQRKSKTRRIDERTWRNDSGSQRQAEWTKERERTIVKAND